MNTKKKIIGLIIVIAMMLAVIMPSIYAITIPINTPTGGFTVNSGETVIIGPGGVVTGNVTVANGGTLYLEDGGIITGNITTAVTVQSGRNLYNEWWRNY
ncbi:MAG: polymer-forming cytoskeletal protein [Oscillospiraceae bacterium]|nr:polymer-forming cytoskeletal protein [Oscillospiraceae bacterium]